ncbi:uncharacterized protein LOC119296012 isoform X1 [Triticum dicoccoides]|uniref:uncharacterized protein LOC119296012 isoform X1 n=1 Tax=Triticum dicoccoides TaxID=85692 RepID=UPI00188F5E83|nr:uncharacterized protein LOC119296012 isoform X1 [Triticum dicoccoides]
MACHPSSKNKAVFLSPRIMDVKAKKTSLSILTWHRPSFVRSNGPEIYCSLRSSRNVIWFIGDLGPAYLLAEGQVIETDTTNILIRHLQLKKKESEAKDAGSRTPGESGKGKRCAARSLGVQKSSKKPNLGSSSGLPSSDEAISGFSQHTLQSFTVERLRALLRQRGLTTKGKKDELITRLREAQS